MATFVNTDIDDRAERPVRCRQPSQGLVIAQMAFGSLLVILETIGLGLGIYTVDLVTCSGGGIWSGLFFVLTGITGLLAMAPLPTLPAIRKKRLTTFLVLSIISSVIAAALAVFSIVSFVMFPMLYVYKSMTDTMDFHSSHANYEWDFDRLYLCVQVVRITSLVAYLVLFVCCIISAAFGCCNVCRSSKSSPGLPHGQYVIYQVHPNAPVPQSLTGMSSNYGAQFPVTFPLDGDTESFAQNSLGQLSYSKGFKQRSLL